MLKREELVPTLMIFSGVCLLSWWVIFPVFEAKASLRNWETDFVSPSLVGLSTTLSRSFNLPALPFLSLLERNVDDSQFFLTIEKLGIEKAKVIASVDVSDPDVYLRELLQGVGHLAGSAFPGEKGSVFLFGHSSLPFLFSESNYATIFSNLSWLRKGDLVVLEFAGRLYRYRVEAARVVEAGSKVAEVQSRRDELILLTCFPPGLLTERLIVTALPAS